MRHQFSLLSAPLVLTITLCSSAFSLLHAAEYTVSTPKEFQKVMKKIQAGDDIILANGTWKDFEIDFKGQGTESAPITLKAETKGKVLLTGNSNLRLSGQYLVVSGLVFKDGFTPSSEVISFRRNKEDLAFHSRVTETVIDNYTNPDRQESDYWVGLYGQHNRFDHNYLAGKGNKGVTMAVRLTSEDSQQNYHRIDHNYFGPRPVFGSNGGETLRIGTSHFSLTDSHTLVENNFFDRTNGEVEIISIKSGKNQILNNVFFEARGTLTMRHGNGNIIEGNVFKGNGVDHTGGIRVINRDQIVKNNYMEGLTGYRFGSGFTVMNGVIDSPINRYHQVVNANITNNTLIDVQHIHLAAGSDVERQATPLDSVFSNNLVINNNPTSVFSIFDDISGIKFDNNVSNNPVPAELSQGFKLVKQVKLKRAENGLLYPVDKALANQGATKDLKVIAKKDTGPSWYPKAEPVVAFSSGKTIQVKPGEDALYNAVAHASSGDIITMADGVYDVAKVISLDKTITISAVNTGKVTLNFERTSLFEINNGGSLQLVGLVMSGKESPDSAGNTLVRTAKWGMLKNYRFIMRDSVVSNLDVNHSNHFFDSGAGAFADLIELTNNRFETITGDILRLNKEQEDLGIYNAEYVIVKNNEFSDIGGTIANVYRGGTDESTFGPHFVFENNVVNNVGNNKRNKGGAVISLHGVQVATIDNNSFTNTPAIKIEHTVGEPITNITNNDFVNSAPISVVELTNDNPHTATLVNNNVTSK